MKFQEEQKFTQWWLWLILLGVACLPIIGIYLGNEPKSDFSLILFAIVMICILVFFWLIQLKTEIDQKEIRMRFVPFTKRNVSWEEVKSAKIVNYGFVGGWGIRLWTKYGTVYNVKGNTGLAIELKSGKKFLIGTQKETELNEVIKSINN